MNIISRPWEPQDLLDDLQMYIDEEPDNYLNGRRTTMCMARDYLKDHFREDTKMMEWISVKERLPEMKDDVLVYFQSGKNMAVGFLRDMDEDKTMWGAYTDDELYTDCDSEPTHWMPLPEPPEVEV